MKIAKIAFFAAFVLPAAFSACFALSERPSAAPELPAFTAIDIASTDVSLKFPEPAAMRQSPRSGRPPVVITVAGLRYSTLDLKALTLPILKELFNSAFNEQKMTDRRPFDAAFKGFLRQNDEMSGEEATARMNRELPDNYLEARLQELPEYAAHSFTIIPFPWSRDPADSDTLVPYFAERLKQVCDTYKGTGRPIYILAHSWGSVLMHDAMHKLAKTRPDFKIDKFITTGSPLTPSYDVIRGFMEVERRNEGLMNEVSKPASVREWINIWSSRDILSNAIPAADSNTQADAALENLEQPLIRIILTSPSMSVTAGKDLIKLRNFIPWHKSYIYDFTATLESLNKNINLPVFLPVVARELVRVRP